MAPRKPARKKHTRQVNIRLTPEEYELIRAVADPFPVTTWIRAKMVMTARQAKKKIGKK